MQNLIKLKEFDEKEDQKSGLKVNSCKSYLIQGNEALPFENNDTVSEEKIVNFKQQLILQENKIKIKLPELKFSFLKGLFNRKIKGKISNIKKPFKKLKNLVNH